MIGVNRLAIIRGGVNPKTNERSHEYHGGSQLCCLDRIGRANGCGLVDDDKFAKFCVLRIDFLSAMRTKGGIALNQSLTTRTLNKWRYARVCEWSIRLNFHASEKDIILAFHPET
jgi:hypothetical protein